MDDATSEIYSAFLVEEQGTDSTFRALLEVFVGYGLPLSLYTDRGSHYSHTAEAGGVGSVMDSRRFSLSECPFKTEFKGNRNEQQRPFSPCSLLPYVCGRHPLGKNFRRSGFRLGLRSCVRPLNAAASAAGPDGVRKWDPKRFCALEVPHANRVFPAEVSTLRHHIVVLRQLVTPRRSHLPDPLADRFVDGANGGTIVAAVATTNDRTSLGPVEHRPVHLKRQPWKDAGIRRLG